MVPNRVVFSLVTMECSLFTEFLTLLGRDFHK